MKIILYIFGGLLLIAASLYAYFQYQTKIPSLDMPAGLTEAAKLTHIDTWLASLQQNGKFNGAVEPLEPDFMDGVAGDGGVFSSIEDFLIWDKFWYENPIISQENLQEAFKMPVLNNGKTSDYGFGWVIAEENRVWHNGAWLGARTLIVRNTKTKKCRVFLDNGLNWKLEDIAREIGKGLKSTSDN